MRIGTQRHRGWVWSIEFSPDSALIASGSRDHTIRLWCCDTGECIKEFQGHSCTILSVVFSPDSALVASGSCDQTVRLWHRNTGECVQVLQGHSYGVWSVAFSPDSVLVASSSRDDTVRLWRRDTGECVQIGDMGTSLTQLSFEANGPKPLDASTKVQCSTIRALKQSMRFICAKPAGLLLLPLVAALLRHGTKR